MGFLTNENVLSFEVEERKRKMQRWAEENPFCAVMMSDLPFKEKVKFAENRHI